MDRDNPTSGLTSDRGQDYDNIVISICTTCKTADGQAQAGPDLLAATTIAVGSDDAVMVRAVQCLGVCKRPTTAAVSAPGGYTFVFGDLQTDSGASALAGFARRYPQAGFGLVPWRERAEVLRRGLVARIPPAAWSPPDGRPPK
jgi:predicted metal-binding protein